MKLRTYSSFLLTFAVALGGLATSGRFRAQTAAVPPAPQSFLGFAAGGQILGTPGRLGPAEGRYLMGSIRFLDDLMARLRRVAPERAEHGSMEFDGNLFFAQGSFVPYFSIEEMKLYADALIETGVRRIDLYVDSKAYFVRNDPQSRAVVAKYDQIVRYIYGRGMKLVLDPQYDVKDSTIQSLEDYERAVLPVYAEMARRYHPFLFNVMHEPTTLKARSGLDVTPKWALGFVERAARVVKEASPQTRVGAYGLSFEMPFIHEFASSSQVRVMGLDVYDLKHVPQLNEIVRLARQVSKPIGMAETWRGPYVDPWHPLDLNSQNAKDIGDGRFQELDQKWLEAMVMYSSVMGLESFDPFWTPALFKYNTGGPVSGISYRYLKAVSEALARHERTKTYHVYKRLIAQYGRKPPA